ncbi:hypothetical protein [Neomegalonema sp.]|uniref:hypothetical protein n=1 Tax=Neomegalonema sp. TaxID=2039713 RepID=UPI002602D3FC|nr:hypothetical protein [Neomegalonema sp.]MDD2869654.1 hypothetical protein [Neomegalonema sp.]
MEDAEIRIEAAKIARDIVLHCKLSETKFIEWCTIVHGFMKGQFQGQGKESQYDETELVDGKIMGLVHDVFCLGIDYQTQLEDDRVTLNGRDKIMTDYAVKREKILTEIHKAIKR